MSENFIRCDTAKKIFRPKLVCQTSCRITSCKYHPKRPVSVPRHRGDHFLDSEFTDLPGKEGSTKQLSVQKLRGIKASGKTPRGSGVRNKKRKVEGNK
jgi:hypothetical protein